ncbi:MAG: hypothetical protein AB8G23_21615 [Myxococcota bacterium]
MGWKMKIAAACYGVSAIYCLTVGLSFVFRTEFFPFHSDVIQTPWSEVEPLAQTLYLGMMRTEGAGFLATAVALGALLAVPFRRGEAWAYWAMTAIGVVEHVPTLLANLHVSAVSPGSPPWQAAAVGIILLLIGLGFGLAGARKENT